MRRLVGLYAILAISRLFPLRHGGHFVITECWICSLKGSRHHWARGKRSPDDITVLVVRLEEW